MVESLFFTLEKQKRLRNSTFSSFHPEGIEPPSQEPESYVISITLRVATVIVYQILENFTSKKESGTEIGNSLEFDFVVPPPHS